MGKVAYVTGAPASGESSTTRPMLDGMGGIAVWEYGARLTEHLGAAGVDLVNQDELCGKSSRLAVMAAIDEVDDMLLDLVASRRSEWHVLIDGHSVTREYHGFRITAFSQDGVRVLAPEEICCCYTAPEVAVARIAADPRGRPNVDVETARMHTMLQASVAATYGMAAGCLVYLVETHRDQQSLVVELRDRLGR